MAKKKKTKAHPKPVIAAAILRSSEKNSEQIRTSHTSWFRWLGGTAIVLIGVVASLATLQQLMIARPEIRGVPFGNTMRMQADMVFVVKNSLWLSMYDI
jgi:hypothetical protein